MGSTMSITDDDSEVEHVKYKSVQLAADGTSNIETVEQSLKDLQQNFNMCVEARSRTLRDYDLIKDKYALRKEKLEALVEAGQAEYEAKLRECAVASEAAADRHRREVSEATAGYAEQVSKLQETNGDSDTHVDELKSQNAYLLERLQAADTGLTNARAASRLEKTAAEEQHAASRTQSRDTLAAAKATCSEKIHSFQKHLESTEATAMEQMAKTRACSLHQVKLQTELQQCLSKETKRTAEAVDDKTRDLQHALAVSQSVTIALVRALQAPTLKNTGPLRIEKIQQIMAIAAQESQTATSSMQ
jgi:hypothetical protein